VDRHSPTQDCSTGVLRIPEKGLPKIGNFWIESCYAPLLIPSVCWVREAHAQLVFSLVLERGQQLTGNTLLQDKTQLSSLSLECLGRREGSQPHWGGSPLLWSIIWRLFFPACMLHLLQLLLFGGAVYSFVCLSPHPQGSLLWLPNLTFFHLLFPFHYLLACFTPLLLLGQKWWRRAHACCYWLCPARPVFCTVVKARYMIDIFSCLPLAVRTYYGITTLLSQSSSASFPAFPLPLTSSSLSIPPNLHSKPRGMIT
jgi:hypothetical protein